MITVGKSICRKRVNSTQIHSLRYSIAFKDSNGVATAKCQRYMALILITLLISRKVILFRLFTE